MIDISICYTAADREIASAVATRLSPGADANVSLDECAEHELPSSWAGDTAVLLLSSNSVPARFDRTEWARLLNHSSANVSCLLIEQCAYPRLLERKNFLRWNGGAIDTLRALERWALGLHALSEHAGFAPAQLPWFEGRQPELDLLWRTLVDGAGTAVIVQPEAGGGKTSLAQEFARQAGAHFREIRWNTPGGEGRVLHVLDDVRDALPCPISIDGRASVLITTRCRDLTLPHDAVVIHLEQYPTPVLHIPEEAGDVRLWKAMAACRSDGFPLELPARIAEVTLNEARSACERLTAFRVVDPFDKNGPRFRLNTFSIAAAGATPRRRHAEVLRAAFRRWNRQPEQCEAYIGEIASACPWALLNDWESAVELTKKSFEFLKARGGANDGAERLKQLRDSAELRGDLVVVRYCDYELSWLNHLGPNGPPPGASTQLGFDF